MKTLYLLLPALCLFIMAGCKEVRKEHPVPEPAQEQSTNTSEASAKALEAAVEQLRKAIITPEAELLDSLTADALSYGHSSGLIQDKATFTDDLLHGAFDFTSVDFTDQQITVSGTTAVVRHIFHAEATRTGEAVTIRIGVILVYVMQDGRWKLLARQAYKL